MMLCNHTQKYFLGLRGRWREGLQNPGSAPYRLSCNSRAREWFGAFRSDIKNKNNTRKTMNITGRPVSAVSLSCDNGSKLSEKLGFMICTYLKITERPQQSPLSSIINNN